MGHLYRTQKVAQQLKLSDFRVVTSNKLATNFFSREQITFIHPDDYLTSWQNFTEQLSQLQPEAFFIDTFPLGIVGELSVLRSFHFPLHYIARRLKWAKYLEVLGDANIAFASTLVLEPLESSHGDFIARCSTRIEKFQLHYPVPDFSKAIPEHIPSHRKIWLVVHTFNKEEVEALLQYAQETARLEAAKPFFLVLSDQQVEMVDGMCMHHPSVVDWFPIADRIFVGAGFNSVQQVLSFSKKTTMVPFPRKYDDQFWRASYYRTVSINEPQYL